MCGVPGESLQKNFVGFYSYVFHHPCHLQSRSSININIDSKQKPLNLPRFSYSFLVLTMTSLADSAGVEHRVVTRLRSSARATAESEKYAGDNGPSTTSSDAVNI